MGSVLPKMVYNITMILYYGADREVIAPEYNKGNPSNDYGLGFYLTPSEEMARLWASKFPGGGYLIKYEVDFSNLNVLRLNTIQDDDVLIWISILIAHRFSKEERNTYKANIKWLEEHCYIDLNQYDVIVGYRADDSYFDYSRDFVANDLSLELLKDAMMLGKLGIQYVLKSKRSFSRIKFVSSTKVEASGEYDTFRNKTKNEYYVIKKEDDINNTYLRDIMRKKL